MPKTKTKKSKSIDSKKLESGKERMTLGAILLISIVLMYITIPNTPTKHIAALIIFGVAIYLMLS